MEKGRRREHRWRQETRPPVSRIMIIERKGKREGKKACETRPQKAQDTLSFEKRKRGKAGEKVFGRPTIDH